MPLITAKYSGSCHVCGDRIEPGDRIFYQSRRSYCATCAAGGIQPATDDWNAFSLAVRDWVKSTSIPAEHVTIDFYREEQRAVISFDLLESTLCSWTAPVALHASRWSLTMDPATGNAVLSVWQRGH